MIYYQKNNKIQEEKDNLLFKYDQLLKKQMNEKNKYKEKLKELLWENNQININQNNLQLKVSSQNKLKNYKIKLKIIII